LEKNEQRQNQQKKKEKIVKKRTSVSWGLKTQKRLWVQTEHQVTQVDLQQRKKTIRWEQVQQKRVKQN